MFRFSQSNFDLVLLVAAGEVAAKHSLVHLVPDEFLYWAKACFAFVPGIPIFFFPSGFLISRLQEWSPSAAEYARNLLDRSAEGSMPGLGWIPGNGVAARHGALAVAPVDTSAWVVAVPVVAWRCVSGSGPGFGDIARSVLAPWLTALPVAAVAGIGSLLAIRLSLPLVHVELVSAVAGTVRNARSLKDQLVARFVSRGS